MSGEVGEQVKKMDSVSRLKAIINKMVTALRADEARPAMTKDERTRYKLKLRQARTKLAQREDSSKQTASSVQHHGNQRRAPSRARVVQVVMTNSYGRRQSGVQAMCLAGNGISFAWGVHSGSVKRALVGLSKGPCSCGASFHMRE